MILQIGITDKTVLPYLKTIEVGKNEHIVGIKANMCDKYIRGIGFFVWKLGMGIPLFEMI